MLSKVVGVKAFETTVDPPLVRVLFPIIGNFNPFSIETFKKRENIKIDKKKQGKTDTTSIYLSNICNQLWTMFAANGRSFF